MAAAGAIFEGAGADAGVGSEPVPAQFRTKPDLFRDPVGAANVEFVPNAGPRCWKHACAVNVVEPLVAHADDEFVVDFVREVVDEAVPYCVTSAR